MKLASLKAGRDGRLVVVARDLSRCAPAESIAPTLQAALDRWAEAEPLLRALAEELETGTIAGQRFEQSACASPLPRAYQWLDGSAYVTHVELVRKARGAELPERFWSDPLMYQGASDGFVGPRDPIEAAGEDWGIEIDRTSADSPDGVEVIAEIPDLLGPGFTAQMTYYETRHGAKVFAAGAFTLAGQALEPGVPRVLANLWTKLPRP